MGMTSGSWSHLLWGRTGQRTFLNDNSLANLCEREVSVKFPWSGYYQILLNCSVRWVRFISFMGCLLHGNSVPCFLQLLWSVRSPMPGFPKEACSLGFIHGCISFAPVNFSPNSLLSLRLQSSTLFLLFKWLRSALKLWLKGLPSLHC